MSQIMKPQLGIKPGRHQSRLPLSPPEVRSPQKRTLRTDEDELADWCRSQVLRQDLRQKRRDRQHATARVTLGLLNVDRRCAANVLQRPDDANLPPENVEVLSLEAHELAPPAAEVHGRVH